MTLRRQILRGGMMLTARQAVGMVLSLGGALLLTRAIGPEQYGLYAAALGVLTYLQVFSQWGVSVYLIRREAAPSEEVYHQATTLLLGIGGAVTLVALAALSLLSSWMRIPHFSDIALPLFLGLPLILSGQVPMARLERDLQYQRVAVIELGAQVIYYGVALPLAFRGAGAWAAVAGWWAQQAVAVTLTFVSAHYRPRLRWDRSQVREMVHYGLGFSASTWVWQLRSLVNPLVVGRYGGAASVGYVALAIRIVEVLSFVKTATWRLSIAALARIRDDRARLARSVAEGMKLQALAVGPPLLAFGLVASVVIPRFFGPRWSAVPTIYPFIALSYLANSLFNLHSSALYVLRRNWDVTLFHSAHVVLFAGSALLLVPRLGLRGYGVAEVVALASYLAIQRLLVRQIGRIDCLVPLAWGMALGLALFAAPDRWWALGGLAAVVLWPAAWSDLAAMSRSFREVLRAA